MAGTFSSRWQGHFQVDAFSAAGVWLLCTELEGWISGILLRACVQTGHSILRGGGGMWANRSLYILGGGKGGGRKRGFLIQVIEYCVQRKTFIRWRCHLMKYCIFSSFFLSEHHSLKEHFGRIHWLLTGQYSICSFSPPHFSVGAHLHNRYMWYLQDRYIYMVLLFLTNRHVRNMAWKFGNHALTLTCNVTMPSLWLVIYAARQRENAECSGDRNVIVRMPATQNHSLPSFRPVCHIFM